MYLNPHFWTWILIQKAVPEVTFNVLISIRLIRKEMQNLLSEFTELAPGWQAPSDLS